MSLFVADRPRSVKADNCCNHIGRPASATSFPDFAAPEFGANSEGTSFLFLQSSPALSLFLSGLLSSILFLVKP